ncbi:MAG: NAD(P)/FAD-dependent oxidoreductase [Christensenellales bacterium]
MKIAVIGAGASGLFLSGLISEAIKVDLYEKNNMLGKKLLITGSGRCNVTNLKTPQAFLENVFEGKKFFQSAINAFTPFDLKELLNLNGIKLIVEENDKAFPKEEKAEVILNFLKNRLGANVKIFYETPVLSVVKENEKFIISSKKGNLQYDTVVISTGGKSYALTGSTGDGYAFAKNFGHTVTPLRQSLCGLLLNDELLKQNMGVSLFASTIIVDEFGKVKAQEKGDVMLTHFGVSGPSIHRLSAKFEELNIENHFLLINFFPHLTQEEMKKRIEDFCLKSPQFEMSKLFENEMPKRLLNTFKDKFANLFLIKAGQLAKKDRLEFINLLTKYKTKINGFDSFDRSIVTRGGVSEKEINPKTFESKLVPKLYFTGEVVNVDGITGGFNLQIAFSSAFACSKAINEKFLTSEEENYEN